MRLAIIRQRYNPYGGAERFVDQAIEALLEHGVDVSLYTREWHAAQQSRIEPVICNPRYFGSTWRDWSFARAVRKALRRNGPDLVQSHERIAGCDIFRAGDGVHRAWLAERRRRLGFWAALGISINPYHRYTLKAEARLFADPRLRAVICNSHMVRAEIKAHYGVSDDKLHVIYNSVDSGRFSAHLRTNRSDVRDALHIPDEAIVFVLVGSGFARKGLASAIEALARLPDSVHLIAVGGDKNLRRYRAQAAGLGLGTRAHLVGPQRDPGPFYGASDAFVLPTIYDPCPNAALEAMACGLPIVTSTQCGAAELATTHGAGLVCDSGDIAGLTGHMRALLDRTTRERMGAAAGHAMRELTPDAMTRQLLLLYEKLLRTLGTAAVEAGAPSSGRSAGSDVGGAGAIVGRPFP